MSDNRCQKRKNAIGRRNFARQNSGGFIALVSAIIISATLIAIVLSLNLSSFFTRFNILDSENKRRSEFLAEICLDTARMNLEEDKTYVGNEKIMEGGDSCRVCSVQISSGAIEIQTRASVGYAYTNLKAILNPTNFLVVSFEELPVSTAPGCSLQ